MLKTVTADPMPGIGMTYIKGAPPVAKAGQTYQAWTNSHGAVAAVMDGGAHLGLRPAEFEVETWHQLGTEPAEQSQGEPVAWVRFRNGEPDYDGDAVMISNVRGDTLGDGDSWEPVFAHAAPGEVERWKKQAEYNQDAALRWLAELEALRPEVERLRAQLAERDALLHEVSISPDWSLSVDLQVRISDALSSSTEPADACAHSYANKHGCAECGEAFDDAGTSVIACQVDESCGKSAPVGRDERAEFDRTEGQKFLNWYRGRYGVTPMAAGDRSIGEYAAWLARAALERKPS